MDTTSLRQSGSLTHPEGTAVEEQTRIEREAAIIARAEAEIDAGFGIDDDALEQWLRDLDQDETLPVPKPAGTEPSSR